jgi:hypothetical protein
MYHYYRNPVGTIIGDNEEEKRERLITLRMFYEQCIHNRWMETFHDEIELIFIRKYYVEMLEVMFRTFEKADYSVFCGIRDWLSAKFPDFLKNPYLVGSYSEMDRLFLRCITDDFNEQQLAAVQRAFLSVVYHKERPENCCKKNLRELYYPQKEVLFAQLEKVCENPTKENQREMQNLLSMISGLEEEQDILGIAVKQENRLPSEIYRYVIDREIFMSYLQDVIRRSSEQSPKIINMADGQSQSGGELWEKYLQLFRHEVVQKV